jgi:hypothetical protein
MVRNDGSGNKWVAVLLNWYLSVPLWFMLFRVTIIKRKPNFEVTFRSLHFFWHNCVLEVLQALSHKTSAQFGEQLTYWALFSVGKFA